MTGEHDDNPPMLVGRKSEKTGLPPGSAVFVGEQVTEEVLLTVFRYDEELIESIVTKSIEECMEYADSCKKRWIDISGLHDAVLIEKLCSRLGIHPLTIEDILNTEQRAKTEIYEDYVFVILKFYKYHEGEIVSSNVGVIFGNDFTLSFQEGLGDCFVHVRERLSGGKGRIRRSGTDYLAYALIDNVVDGYFRILEYLGDRAEEIEEELISRPGQEVLEKIHILRSEIVNVRKAARPLWDAVKVLVQGDTHLVNDSTVPYIKDLQDHVIQIMDTSNSLKDSISGMLEIYNSSISNRLNETMKFLTMVATIFIPMTFIAGIYGMNFESMPELGWRWGYFFALAIMGILGISMYLYFRFKKWF